jgi:hypothetical protein
MHSYKEKRSSSISLFRALYQGKSLKEKATSKKGSLKQVVYWKGNHVYFAES